MEVTIHVWSNDKAITRVRRVDNLINGYGFNQY